MAQLWIRWRFSEDDYRVWVVNSWRKTLGLGQNETKWEEETEIYENADQTSHENADRVRAKWKEVIESFPKFQSLSGWVWVANLITLSLIFLCLLNA